MRVEKPHNSIQRPPRHLFAFDTETRNEPINEEETRLVWKLGTAIYYDRKDHTTNTLKTTNANELVVFLLDSVPKRGTLWVYAHNIYFDFKVAGLHTALPEHGYKLEWFYFSAGGGNAIIVFKRGTQKIKLINTFNYYPLKLAKIGKIIGLDKWNVDFETSDTTTLMNYCFRDCEIVMEAMKLFHNTMETHLGVCASLTAGSTAYSAWRNTQGGSWVNFHDDSTLTAWERMAYKGGRTECFRLGALPGRWHCLDINSMYPFIMSTTPIPCRIVKAFGIKNQYESIQGAGWWRKLSRFVVHDDEGFTLRRDGSRAGIMADCLLRVDQPAIGVMHEDKLCFPVGTFRVTLACSEFEYAFNSRWIEQVYAVEIWRMDQPFSEYVERIWTLRHEFQRSNNHGMATAIKLVGNSLYGKFAQRKIIEVGREPCEIDAIRSEICVLEGGKGVLWELCGQRVYMLTTQEATRRTHYPVAAQITAAARLYLWRLICHAGKENVAYVDTDSLFVNDNGYARLGTFLGDSLGDLKVEWTDERLEVHGLKDYRTSVLAKRKGIKEDAVFVESQNAWRQTQFVGLRGDLRTGNKKGIIIKTVHKKLARKYSKGTVAQDGTVKPLELS